MEIDLIRNGRRQSRRARKPRGVSGAPTDLIRYWVAQVLSIPSAWRKGWCRHEQRFEHDDLLELLKFARPAKASCAGHRRRWPVSSVHSRLQSCWPRMISIATCAGLGNGCL